MIEYLRLGTNARHTHIRHGCLMSKISAKEYKRTVIYQLSCGNGNQFIASSVSGRN